jgi:DNA polymerase (family 10)
MAEGNQTLVALFRELVRLTVLDEGSPNAFRARAYERAMEAIAGHSGDLGELSLKQLQAIDGIGASTGQKIREFFERGTIGKLEELRQKFPPELVELSAIPGLGPKTLLRLRSELGVRNLQDLRRALEQRRLRELPGLGEKLEEKLRLAVERTSTRAKDKRRPTAEVMPIARELVEALAALPGVERAQYCGSLRRLRETVADVDIVVAAREAQPVREAFVKLKMVREVIGSGDTKASVRTSTGLQVDLRIVEPHQFGAACQYFTGSKAHNIKLRQRALERGWTLNEYGLSDTATGRVIAPETEEAIYRALGLPLVPPPMREDRGEIELAEAGQLPGALKLEDVRGDLHVHTDLSGDGRSALEDVLASGPDGGRDRAPERAPHRPPSRDRAGRGRGAPEGGRNRHRDRDQRRARPARRLERGAAAGPWRGRDVRGQHRHAPHTRARPDGVGRAAGDARLRGPGPHRQPVAARALPRLAAAPPGPPAAVSAPRRVFLLSPADCAGKRARLLLLRVGSESELALRLHGPEGAALGELFSFVSSLYFRGKLAYARAFARPPLGQGGIHVITPSDGLKPPESRVRPSDLQRFGRVPIDLDEPRYREPLLRDLLALAASCGEAEVVLLGSVASGKYADLVAPILGARLVFPLAFVGRGDMSRGGLMLRSVSERRELTYVPLLGAERRGSRPPRLTPRVD